MHRFLFLNFLKSVFVLLCFLNIKEFQPKYILSSASLSSYLCIYSEISLISDVHVFMYLKLCRRFAFYFYCIKLLFNCFTEWVYITSVLECFMKRDNLKIENCYVIVFVFNLQPRKFIPFGLIKQLGLLKLPMPEFQGLATPLKVHI